jgi:hypothetical protein
MGRPCIACCFSVLSYLALPAYAVECNPTDLKDVTLYTQDIQTKILFLQDYRKSANLSNKTAVGIGLPGYANLTGQKQEEYVDTLINNLHLDVNVSDRRYLYLSAMNPHAREMYKDCLDHLDKSIFVVPSANSQLGDTFSVNARLRNFPSDRSIPTFITVTGGNIQSEPPAWTFDHGKTTRIAGKIRAGTSVAVNVRRDLNKPFEFTVTAGSPGATQNETMALPSQPAEVKQELRISKVITLACNGCPGNAGSDTLCVNVPDNEVIVPGSERFVAMAKGDGTEWTTQENSHYPATNPGESEADYLVRYSGLYQPHQSCLAVAGRGLAKGRTWCGSGYVSVQVLLSVPRGTSSSGRVPKEPTLDCELH